MTTRTAPQIQETAARLGAVAEELRAVSAAPDLSTHHALVILKMAARLEALTLRLVAAQAWTLR